MMPPMAMASEPPRGATVDIIDDRSPREHNPAPRRILVDGTELHLPAGASITICRTLGDGDDCGTDVMIAIPARRVRIGYSGELHSRTHEAPRADVSAVEA